MIKAAARISEFISPQGGSSGLKVAGLMVGCLMYAFSRLLVSYRSLAHFALTKAAAKTQSNSSARTFVTLSDSGRAVPVEFLQPYIGARTYSTSASRHTANATSPHNPSARRALRLVAVSEA